MICMQITDVLKCWAPPELTGFLPGRGSVTAVLQAQHQLEWSRWKRQRLSGLVLDLRKCFNCLRLSFCYHAMRSCGIPSWVLDAWLHAQSSLCRYWLIQGNLFEAGNATTGCPEGDQMSVVAMVCVSIAWIFYCKQAVASTVDLALTAYADNWFWTVKAVEEHSCLLQSTQNFTAAAGVQIDWDKTWWWVSDGSLSDRVSAIISEVAPGSVTRSISSPDLGFQMQYGKQNRFGVLQTRLNTGFDRLKRLSSMKCSLSVKEHMLVSSIYPATFHGFETKPPAQDVFQRLRSSAARALIGDASSLSPSVALLFGNKGVLDPEFHFIWRLLLLVRRFLFGLSRQRVLDFFHLASHFLGLLHQVHGPAAALGFTLRNLGWQINSSGVVSVDTLLDFDLLHCSPARLRRFLENSWQTQHIRTFTSRWGWFEFPDISILDTRKILSLFQDPQRTLLIRELAGGYQLSTQKKHWLESEDGICRHCGQENSRRHRWKECPIGSDIREPFASLFQYVESTGSCMLDFPAVFVHPDRNALRLLHFSFVLPVWPVKIHLALENHLRHAGQPHFYTDGSCQFPSEPSSRYSAFSVVWDLCRSDEERVQFANDNIFQGDHTRCFQRLATGMTPGEQDILRAELTAIVNVIENTCSGIIFVDSQAALNLAEVALRSVTVADFAGKEHVDLLIRIHARRLQVNFQLQKVKAHEKFSDVPDPPVRFRAMGNSFADHVAVSTRKNLLPDLVRTHHRVHKEITADQDNLYALFKLHLLLLAARGRALQDDQVAKQPMCDF